MHFTLTVWAALLTFRSVAAGVSIFSQQLCITKIGTKSSSPVPSSTSTISIPITFTSKVTVSPVSTIMPAPTTTLITSTLTQTSMTTLPSITDTVTTTQEDLVTSTSTSTETETDTETSTVVTTSTSTSTVPTPAGFTPISLEPGYVPKIKGRDINKLDARAGKTYNTLTCKPGYKPVVSPALYPVAVSCVKFIETITTKIISVTGTKTSTIILPQATSTATSTITTVTTSTITPAPATSTITASTTSTVSTSTVTTTTTTLTVTTTSTSIVPGPTTYAACASNNIITRANGGQGIVAFSKNNEQSFGVVSADSAYDCCVACQTATNCAGTAFVGGSCYTVLSGTCTPGQFNGDNFQTSGSDEGFTVSNGPCGAIANGGSA